LAKLNKILIQKEFYYHISLKKTNFANKNNIKMIKVSNINEEVVLGIDPGTNVMGYSFIIKKDGKINILEMNVLKLNTKIEMSTRMKTIFDFIIDKINEYKPDILALEAPFYGKNVQSMLKLGRVQGICIAAGLSKDIPFMEFEPRKVKQSITGNGASSKEQVAKMLQRTIGFKEIPTYLDATDSLAVAVCYLNQNTLSSITSKLPKTISKSSVKKKTWTTFINENPNRVCK
jgi:crossover junction endodeoxyribonuclease RuvC